MEIMNKSFEFSLLVNFEDVDAGGGVYHPNYLNYLERARSQVMRDLGVPFSEFLTRGFALVVAENHALYLKPAFLEQRLTVVSRVTGFRRNSMKILQAIFNKKPEGLDGLSTADLVKAPGVIHVAQLRLVCVDLTKKVPCEFPDFIKTALGLPMDLTTIPVEFSDVRIQLPAPKE